MGKSRRRVRSSSKIRSRSRSRRKRVPGVKLEEGEEVAPNICSTGGLTGDFALLARTGGDNVGREEGAAGTFLEDSARVQRILCSHRH